MTNGQDYSSNTIPSIFVGRELEKELFEISQYIEIKLCFLENDGEASSIYVSFSFMSYRAFQILLGEELGTLSNNIFNI